VAVSGACDRCPTTEQWGELCAAVGRLEATAEATLVRVARLEGAAAKGADESAEALREEIATLKAEKAETAKARRDLVQKVALAVLAAALGVLGGAAAKGAQRPATTAMATAAGAGGAPPIALTR
jgi:hypothetical protein